MGVELDSPEIIRNPVEHASDEHWDMNSTDEFRSRVADRQEVNRNRQYCSNKKPVEKHIILGEILVK